MLALVESVGTDSLSGRTPHLKEQDACSPLRLSDTYEGSDGRATLYAGAADSLLGAEDNRTETPSQRNWPTRTLKGGFETAESSADRADPHDWTSPRHTGLALMEVVCWRGGALLDDENQPLLAKGSPHSDAFSQGHPHTRTPLQMCPSIYSAIAPLLQDTSPPL